MTLTSDRVQELVKNAGANPATLEFPTDRWGFTSAVRKAVLGAASMVRGQDDKHLLLLGTLLVLVAHVKARLPLDKQGQAQRLLDQAAFHEELAKREQVAGIRPGTSTAASV